MYVLGCLRVYGGCVINLQRRCNIGFIVLFCGGLMNYTGNDRNTIRTRYRGGIVLLLLFYVIGVLQVESFHSLFHAHDKAELHSVNEEKDPCHRTVYHGEKEQSCEHKTHLKKSDTCASCAVCISSVYLTNHYFESRILSFTAAFFSHEEVFSAASPFCQKSSRAPPVA